MIGSVWIKYYQRLIYSNKTVTIIINTQDQYILIEQSPYINNFVLYTIIKQSNL